MSISTLSFNGTTRASILRLQTDLRDAEKEISTLRHADVGRTLGGMTGSAVSFRAQETSIDRLLESNKIVASRFELMDDALATVGEGAETVMNSLLNGARDANSTAIVVEQARSALAQMSAALNLNVGGQYLFAGAQTDIRPIKGGTDASDATKARYADYLAALPGAPRAATAEELKTFLTAGTATLPAVADSFGELFEDTMWSGNWSAASPIPMEARISRTEVLKSSVSTADEAAFRDIAAGYSMLADLDVAGMGADARQIATETALARLKKGFDAVTALRSRIGGSLARVETADAQLTQQKDIVHAAFERLESVDLTEASLRVTQLETQLEASYTITGRLQSLNILDYL